MNYEPIEDMITYFKSQSTVEDFQLIEHNLIFLQKFSAFCKFTYGDDLGTETIWINFFNCFFKLTLLDECFYGSFFLKLLQQVSGLPCLPQLKADKQYQIFWQYVFKNEFHTFYRIQIYGVLQNCMDKIFTSFTGETLEMYQAMKALHELKSCS